MYTWSRDICATSLCHLRLPEERRGEAVLVDVGRQDRHAVLRLVPEKGGADVCLGKVACNAMQAPRFPCVVVSQCFPVFGRWGVA